MSSSISSFELCGEGRDLEEFYLFYLNEVGTSK